MEATTLAALQSTLRLQTFADRQRLPSSLRSVLIGISLGVSESPCTIRPAGRRAGVSPMLRGLRIGRLARRRWLQDVRNHSRYGLCAHPVLRTPGSPQLLLRCVSDDVQVLSDKAVVQVDL